MKLKLSCFLSAMVVLCFSVLEVKAQLGASQTQYFLPQPFPRSPTATAFEKYGTYKVNEFTGVPDISIPLYTVEAGGFQVPITLSYHASGIKVSDVASWVGLGWSVSSGGQISRKAMGYPDDVSDGYLTGGMLQPGTFDPATNTGVHYLEDVATGLIDSKPDIYSYDFPGHGGKFFFDGSAGHNFAPRFLPYAPLKLKYTLVHYASTNPPPATGLTRFNVTDEHGNNYTFGDANGIETTYSSSAGRPGYISATAWKLETMVSQNRRDTVSFSYQADQVNYPSADGEIYTIVDGITSGTSTTDYNNASYSTSPTTPGNNNVASEKLISQITFKNGKVVFELDPTNRTDVDGTGGNHAYGLKDIKVYKYNYGTKTMELQKTIVFYKSYFNPTGVSRLRLDSIQVQDKAGSTVQHYRFDYNTTVSLPPYTSYQQDYWGYYNGKASNTMFTPQQSVTYQAYSINPVTHVTIGQANRNPDSNYMQAFVLTGIHYPTGGYSTFAYQTNQYDTSGVVALAGGLRIKTINSYDGVNPIPIVKTYVYNSARPNFYLDYDYFYTSQIHRYYEINQGNTLPQVAATETVRTYSSNPHCDLEAYDGATVVYPSVTEYIGTPGTNIGRTDYTFTDQQDAISDATMAGNLIYISSFYARGHLASKKEYIHKTDGSYQPVKLTTNGYTAFRYTNYQDVGLAVKKLNYNEGVAANPVESGTTIPDDSHSFLYPYYYITSDDNYPTGTTTKIYDINDTTKYTMSSVDYLYDNIAHQQVTRTYHVDSKGNTIISRSKYPADYPAGNAIIDSMVNRNMQAEAIEKYDTLKNAATSVNAITGAQLNQYKVGLLTGTIVPSKISTLSVGQPLTNFTPSTISSGALTSDSRYVQMISFDQYDPQNNIIQYTPRNATPTSIIWDYQSEDPIAQVKNATNSYGTFTQVAYTSFEGDGTGNWSFNGKPVFNASAPTGTMVYPLSAGNVISPSLSAGTAYVLSYWSNNGTATVYGGSSLTSNPLTTTNGWTYYECQVPSGVTSVTISGSTTIDELRLYPTAAQMTTYAYDPSGVRSISDTKGLNNYFEYDFAQRLKNSKDYLGNIIANYNYHTYDQTVGNQVQTATFTRNNCPPNTTPGHLTYTVPVNRYYAATLAAANTDAQYEMNTNGQAKANANCGCPIIYVNVTLTNFTGLAGFQATFTGVAPFNFPSSGSTVVQVPQGSYATVSMNPLGSGTHTYSVTGFTSIVGHGASFGPVSVTTGSNLTLSVQ